MAGSIEFCQTFKISSSDCFLSRPICLRTPGIRLATLFVFLASAFSSSIRFTRRQSARALSFGPALIFQERGGIKLEGGARMVRLAQVQLLPGSTERVLQGFRV